MGGAFLITRDIFDNLIWHDTAKFRLFFFILGKAAFADGVKTGSFVLKRGQFLRSYRNLRNDLEYIENNALKKYSLDTIKRKIYELVREERISVQETTMGTIFTITNYEQYQCLENYKVSNVCEDVPTTQPQKNTGEDVPTNPPEESTGEDVPTNPPKETPDEDVPTNPPEFKKTNSSEQTSYTQNDSNTEQASYTLKASEYKGLGVYEAESSEQTSYSENNEASYNNKYNKYNKYKDQNQVVDVYMRAHEEEYHLGDANEIVSDNLFKEIGDYYSQLTGRFVNSIDAVEIQKIVEMTDDLAVVKEAMNVALENYKPKFNGDKIRCFKYFSVVIQSMLAVKEAALKNGNTSRKGKLSGYAPNEINEINDNDAAGFNQQFIDKWS